MIIEHLRGQIRAAAASTKLRGLASSDFSGLIGVLGVRFDIIGRTAFTG